jgi:phage-related protein
MSVTENRIVRMIFDNAQFKKAATDTSAQLTNLDKQVANAGKGTGLLDMGKAMDTVKVKASAMQVATVTAIANIANRAVDAGVQMAKSLSVDPILQGFAEYELKMKSIQTILSNTKGETLATVTTELNKLNEYSDKTIYNFANMTQNIGKMTTAGIDLQVATDVVKGFSNMVALAGGDATAAAGALEQFVYGLQAGQIKALDWQSIATRGLGSQSLQQAFFETAKAMGTITDLPVGATFESWTKANGGFKGSLEQGWLTAEVATKALTAMTGEAKTVEDLMAQGFDRKAAEDLFKIAENAERSATEVRTFTAFMDTLKEQIGSGWSQVFELIIGDFNEATKLFTNMSDATGAALGKFFGYLEAVVKGFDKFGGRTAILETIKNILSPIVGLFGLLGKAIQKVFGDGEAGEGAATFAKALQHATRPLRILGELLKGNLTPMEAATRLWEVYKNGIRNVVDWLGKLAGPLERVISMKVPGGEGVIQFIKDLAREIGNAIERVEELVESGASIGDIFGGAKFDMPDMPSMPSMPSIGSIFGGGDAETPMLGLSGAIDKVTGSVSDLNEETKSSGGMFNPDADLTTERIRDVGTLEDQMASAETEVRTLGDAAQGVFGGLKDQIMAFFEGFSMDDLMASFNLAVLSTFLISISRFFNTLSKSFAGFVGTGEAINDVLGGVGNALGSFQTQARAQLILNIAIAVGILAVSLWLLSRIPLDKLATGLAGLAGIMLIMKVGVDSITKAVEAMDGKGTALKLTGLSLALLALGFAVLTLSAAFLILEKVDWSAMLKGLGTIIIVMTMMERLGKAGEHAAKNMVAGAFGIAAIAGSMLILAGALLLFKLVDWESMLKGGLVIGALTGVLLLLAKVPAESLAKAGAAMLGMSVGMLLLANALVIFGAVSWESIAKAGVVLAGLAITLTLMSIFMKNPVVIAGFVSLAAAMVLLATAGVIFNSVDWSSLAKLGLVIGILVLAFGAFLAIVSFFAPALILLSAFAGSLALLAFAIAALTAAFALIFPLLAIGAGAFAAFATGAAIAIAVFLQTLALQAPIMKDSMLKILQAMIDGIVEAVPMIIDGIKRLWEAVKKEFTGGGGGQKQALMQTAGKSWIEKLGDGIKNMMPKIVSTAADLLMKFIGGLVSRARELGARGAELVSRLIDGIASKIGGIVEAATNLIIKFAEGIGKNVDRLATAGVKLIGDFLNGLATAIRASTGIIGPGIRNVVSAMGDVGKDMIQGLIDGIGEMFDNAMGAIGDLASGMVNKAKSILDIFSPSRVFKSIGKFLVEGLTLGIQQNASAAITATAAMVSGSISIASEYMSKFVQDLDQQALAATARANGLAAAAEKAAKAAEKTKKNKKDDKAARRLGDRAETAETRAERRQEAAERARAAAERAEQFEDATLIERAEMRAEDAQTQIDMAKAKELDAASKLEQARALREQAKAKGVSNKDAKEFRKQAERLEKQAEKDANEANELITAARASATDAMGWQQQAAAQAAADFQARYDNAAKEDAEEAAFQKLTDEQKAVERRRQAAILQAQADADLARAKELAYTDLDAANELADEAMAAAEQARNYINEAEQIELQAQQARDSQSVSTGGTIVNLDPTETAGIAFNEFAQRYDAGMAASAAGTTLEFNQYNQSPEPLNPTDVYRLTNNQLDFAGARLGGQAA